MSVITNSNWSGLLMKVVTSVSLRNDRLFLILHAFMLSVGGKTNVFEAFISLDLSPLTVTAYPSFLQSLLSIALEDEDSKKDDGISFSNQTGPAWAGSERDYTYEEVRQILLRKRAKMLRRARYLY